MSGLSISLKANFYLDEIHGGLIHCFDQVCKIERGNLFEGKMHLINPSFGDDAVVNSIIRNVFFTFMQFPENIFTQKRETSK